MCQKKYQQNDVPYPRETHAGNCISEPVTSIDMLTPSDIIQHYKPMTALDYMNAGFTAREPAAYIVTDNRGNRYLVFAGSTEHDNAVMFNYEIKPLYE